MADDIDDLLRHAMASLDRQVPAGYFDALPDRALARLDDALDDLVVEEAVTEDAVIGEREEHSGLQDIRNLANETKARLARQSSQALAARDDRLASSSAGWKAVALPDPARRGDASVGQPGDPHVADAPAARVVPAPVADVSASTAVTVRADATTTARAANRRQRVAIIGASVAVAAGAMLVITRRSDDVPQLPRPTTSDVALAPPAGPEISVTPIAPLTGEGAEASPPAPEDATAGSDRVGKRAASKASTAPPSSPAPTKTKGGAKRAGKQLDPNDRPESPPAQAAQPGPPRVGGATAGTGAGSDEPSFDELAREAGVTPAKPAAPRLARKSLSADDIKRGMTAVAAQAEACFTGTAGLASVRLTVLPSGKVAKVAITGPFAGTPTAACVERAVKSAAFPPWDGGPQSFGYSYLLSE
jgi:hypothetical protein